jgi:ribonuclease Z
VLKLTFLGTSSSRPTVRRGVSSLAVQREGDLHLFDCGEGTQRQMMRFAVGFSVRSVFLTHLHADHYLGLPGLLRTLCLQAREEELVVYCPAGRQADVQTLVVVGGERLTFPLRIEGLEPGGAAVFDGYEVRGVRTEHTAPSIGYALVEPDRLGRFDVERARAAGVPEGPLFGRLHRGEDVVLPDGRTVRARDLVGSPRPGRTLVYTGDTRPCAAVREAAREADLLVHEATFTEEGADRARETRHSTAREAGEVAAAAGVARLALTHFSARYSELPNRLAAEARGAFGGEVIAAEDGLEIELPLLEDGE